MYTMIYMAKLFVVRTPLVSTHAFFRVRDSSKLILYNLQCIYVNNKENKKKR